MPEYLFHKWLGTVGKKFCIFQSLELVATNTLQIKKGRQMMFQKLILAVIMTFALNLLLETRPPVLAQADPNAKVALAQILKVRTIRLAFMPNE